MGAGSKAAMLAGALVAAVAIVVLLAEGPEPDGPSAPAPAAAAPEPARGTPGPPRRPPAERPRRERSAAPAPQLSTDVRLAGQVVDDEENPVAGAAVRALREATLTDEVTSGAEGRFTVRCGRRPASGSVEIGVTATFGPSRAAYASFELMEDSPDDDDLGPLLLEPAVPLVARVVDAAGPVAGARVLVGSFFGTVFAAATADEKGVARFETSPATDAWLFAHAPGHGRARGEIPDGRDPKVPLVLTLTARTLSVSIVEVPAGVPLAGERIAARIVTDADGSRLFSSFVPPLDLPATGPTGIVRIDDVAAEDAIELRRVEPEAPSQPWRSAGPGTKRVFAAPREIEARIDVPSGRTLRWRIVPGDAPVPEEGAVVELRRGHFGVLPAGPKALHVEGGHLAGSGFDEGDVRGLAVAPDGAIARLVLWGEARFMLPRALGVTVRDADGKPLEGAGVTLRNAGGRDVGDSRSTGDDGRVAFRGMESDLGILDVWVKSDLPPDARRVAAVDLGRGDADIDVRLPRTQEIVLRVTTDGEHRLPHAWRLLVDQAWEQSAIVDAGDGAIRLVARQRSAGQPIRVALRAEGYLDAEADVACGPGGGPAVVDLALVRGITLWALYRPPSAASRAPSVAPALQQWSPELRLWSDWPERASLGGARRAEPDGRFRFDGVPPGRYRLFASLYSAAGDVVEAVAAGVPAPLVLDLSRAGIVRVRVAGPDDKPAAGAWVGLEGPLTEQDGLAASERRLSAGPDGAVALVYVPGDRAVRLVARHPLLRADPERGSVEVTEPGGEVTLRLIDGPVIAFSTPPVTDAPVRVSLDLSGRRAERPWGTIQLFHGAAEGEPVATANPVFVEGRLRAGGFAPGRYTIWVLVQGGAPVVLHDVDLGDGVTDLGELRPRRGSAIRVRIAVPAGQAAPRLFVTATRIEGPRYSLRTMSGGEAEIVLPGLGPGRFHVEARAASNPAEVTLRCTVEVDGERDVVIDSSHP